MNLSPIRKPLAAIPTSLQPKIVNSWWRHPRVAEHGVNASQTR